MRYFIFINFIYKYGYDIINITKNDKQQTKKIAEDNIEQQTIIRR